MSGEPAYHRCDMIRVIRSDIIQIDFVEVDKGNLCGEEVHSEQDIANTHCKDVEVHPEKVLGDLHRSCVTIKRRDAHIVSQFRNIPFCRDLS